jgi:hypothetical protein
VPLRYQTRPSDVPLADELAWLPAAGGGYPPQLASSKARAIALGAPPSARHPPIATSPNSLKSPTVTSHILVVALATVSASQVECSTEPRQDGRRTVGGRRLQDCPAPGRQAGRKKVLGTSTHQYPAASCRSASIDVASKFGRAESYSRKKNPAYAPPSAYHNTLVADASRAQHFVCDVVNGEHSLRTHFAVSCAANFLYIASTNATVGVVTCSRGWVPQSQSGRDIPTIG